MRIWTRAPLRLRLTLAFAVSMAIVLAALGAFLHFRLSSELLRSVDLELRSRAGVITSALGEPAPVPIDSGRTVIDPDEAFAQILNRDGRVLDASRAVRGAPILPASMLRDIGSRTFLTRQVPGIGDKARLLAVPTNTDGERVVVVVGANLGDRAEALARLQLLLVAGIPVALLLASVTGWFVAGAALRPVEQIRGEAAAISRSGPDRRLTVPETGDELARLAETLNAMLGRQQAALERERRFVDEASHELRTPLAILKAELDLAMSRPRDRAELAETVRAAGAETDRLVALSEQLLVLARSRSGHLPLHRESVSLREFLDRSAEPFRSRAAVEVRAPDEPARVDQLRLRQALDNLLDNAVRHADGAPVTVAAERDGAAVRISVVDSGPGFPPAFVDRAFEPFADHRGDGTGLGLAIVSAAALAHGGHAEARNEPGGGARVTLVIRA